MTLDEAIGKEHEHEGLIELEHITRFGKPYFPHCFYKGALHYRNPTEDGNSYYCTLSNDSCGYYKNIMNKEYCTARLLK